MIESDQEIQENVVNSIFLSAAVIGIYHKLVFAFIGITVIYAMATSILIGGNNDEYKQFSSIICGIREI